ncbi:Myblike DNAbinding domain-containing protein, partial [Rhizophlyctis rosea]
MSILSKLALRSISSSIHRPSLRSFTQRQPGLTQYTPLRNFLTSPVPSYPRGVQKSDLEGASESQREPVTPTEIDSSPVKASSEPLEPSEPIPSPIETTIAFPNREDASEPASTTKSSAAQQKHPRGEVGNPWTRQEDELIVSTLSTALQSSQPIPWSTLSTQLSRPAHSIKLRYTNKLDPSINRSPFTPEDDQYILSTVSTHLENQTEIPWHEMAQHLGNRIPLKVKQRYFNWLKPSLKRGVPFSASEDAQIIKEGQKETPNWLFLANELNRKPDKLIARYTLINPSWKKGDWAPEEDSLILSHLDAASGDAKKVDWHAVSRILNRPADKIRDHYKLQLNPSILGKKGTQFSEREDRLLKKMKGENKSWGEIGSKLERHRDAVFRRWKAL